jgi:hypothetical protein
VTEARLRDLPEVVRAKIRVERETGCWLWLGAKNHKGYGILCVARKRVKAHRATYEALRGPIPPALQPDHLCRVRACVNPWHCEPVTRRENILRGVSFVALNARKTHCIRGHEFTVDNIMPMPGGGRRCRACHRSHRARWKKRRRASIAPPLHPPIETGA